MAKNLCTFLTSKKCTKIRHKQGVQGLSTERTINIINAYFKLCFTFISGVIRVSVQLIIMIPRVLSKMLNIFLKLGLIYKLAIDPTIRSIGAFFAGIWRAWMQKRASSKNRRSGEVQPWPKSCWAKKEATSIELGTRVAFRGENGLPSGWVNPAKKNSLPGLRIAK